MKGFTIEEASIKHVGLWTCVAKEIQQCSGRLENFQQFIVPLFGKLEPGPDYYFYLKYLLIDFDAVEPVIQAESSYKINTGEKISIQCSVSTSSVIKLLWIGPTGQNIESVKHLIYYVYSCS